MTKLQLHPQVIFRVPRFPYNDLIVDNWEELKRCIKTSSNEFYEIIADMTYEEFLSANSKIKMTVQKYYNRATFRSTPYGLFSAVGVTTLDWNKGKINLAERHIEHAFSDWRSKPVLLPAKELMNEGCVFFANTTFYCVGNDIRYIQKSGNDYEIAAVEYDEVIMSIVNSCKLPKTLSQINEQLNLSNSVLKEYIVDLLDVQLLFTSLHPNIIGEDYFTRTGYQTKSDNKYLITERKVIAGNLDQKVFKHLPELVMQMQKILDVNESNNLKKFKEQFIQKFDQAEIPLMIAIDPEAGVGYGSMERHRDGSNVTDLLEQPDKHTSLSNAEKLRNKLYQAIYKNSLNNQPIDLDALIDPNNEGADIPNSLYALCTLVDEHVFIDGIGGTSANALSGRFASAITDVNDYCKDIAMIEQLSNPDVLLFDIGYTKEDKVDNINRRPVIYALQLNILNFDTSESPLAVNDIMISIQRGEVMLRSVSLDKRLVPRFASAYNYKRSDLPLFRLLMDIQSQGIQVNLTLRPKELLPGLPYYPRIQFRNIIVAPAVWLVQRSLVMNVNTLEERCNILSDYLRSILPCSHIKIGSGDQTLLFDTDNKDDMVIMLSLLEQEDEIYVEEAYLPKVPVFTNDDGRPFLPQLVITLTHTNKIWGGMKFQLGQSPTLVPKNWIVPGQEWLYFEIYGNPICLENILLSRIKPFLQAHKQSICSWFFIRYNENGDHIRLRLKLKSSDKGYLLIGSLTKLLNEDIAVGTVADIKLCTYKKEVHRYSAILMDSVEEHFHQDSRFVLNMLSAMLSDFAKYRLCIELLEHVYGCNTVAGNDLDDILKMMAEGLISEHNLNNVGLKKINKMFKEFQQQTELVITKTSTKLFQNLKHSMIKVLEQSTLSARPKLFADLMHMHINRLFVTNQRLHELVIYEFYIAIRKRDKNMSKSHAHTL